MNTIQSTKHTQTIYYSAWLLVALFFLYQYVLRVSPGIMVVEIKQVFKLTASEFSSLGSIYLFSYSLLQIPLGFILDRIGVRRVIVMAIAICMMGTVLFALSRNVLMLQIGRFLIGLGSAPAFISALKIVHDHLPLKYRGLLMGMTLAVGTLGALVSGQCMVALLDNQGWQNALLICAGFGGLLLMLVLAVIPYSFEKIKAEEKFLSHFRAGIAAVFKQRELILYSVIAIGVYTPLCVLADLWGAAYLMEKYELSRAISAKLSLYLYGGLTVGSLIIPWLSVRWGRLKETIQFCIMCLVLAMGFLLYSDSLTLLQLGVLLTIIGLLCGAEMICFAGAIDHSPLSYSGLALGVVNTLNMLGGAFVQQLIGWYLDFQWKGEYGLDGARYYSVTDLNAAFTLLIAIIIICGLLTFFLSPVKAMENTQSPQSA
ncbi:MAG: MFS transporter [Candidatus Berkiella sp.]